MTGPATSTGTLADRHLPVQLFATVCLAPLLIAQGLLVRWRVEKLPEPDGPRAGRVGHGDTLRLLLVGDSATAGVGVERQDVALSGQLVARLATRYQVDWELEATTGATTHSALATLAARDARPFDVALVSLGVNDVTSGVSVSRWRARHRQLRTLLRDRFGVSRLLAFGIPPMGRFPALPEPLRSTLGARADALTRALALDLAGEAHSLFLPMEFALDEMAMARDGFHPGPAIYSAWGQRAADAIDALVSGEGDTP